MSQHYFFTQHQGEPIKVFMGYDKPLDGYFMVIEKEEDSDNDDEDDDGLLYSNLFEEYSHPNNLDGYLAVLKTMNIVVPQQMLDEIKQDFLHRVGNKVVYHTLHNGQYSREQTA
jgi:hypothetical protein